MTTSRSADERTRDDVERMMDNPVLRTVARLGFATSALLQLLVGVLAVQVALDGSDRQTDQSGALSDVAKTPGGIVVLWVGVVGCFALAIWYVVQAVLRRQADAKGRW